MAEILPIHGLVDGSLITAYFRTSDVYSETGGVGAKVSIKKIKEADLTGNEEILPVKEAIRAGLVARIGVRYKDAAGKKKSAKVLCANKKLGDIFGDTPAGKLDGVDYSVNGTSKGKIFTAHNLRRASNY